MWLGPIQDSAFARRCLDSIEGDKEHYGTWLRMQGQLTLAEQVCGKFSSLYPMPVSGRHYVSRHNLTRSVGAP